MVLRGGRLWVLLGLAPRLRPWWNTVIFASGASSHWGGANHILVYGRRGNGETAGFGVGFGDGLYRLWYERCHKCQC